MSDRNTSIRRGQLKPIQYDDLDATNAAVDNYIPSYDQATGKFTWVENVAGISVHNDLTSIQGGQANEYYHLTAADYNELSDFLGGISVASGNIITFTSFPITPSSAPTTDYQAANKKYVDDSVAGLSPDKISEGDSLVEVVDSGSGYIIFKVDNVEEGRFNASGLKLKSGTDINEFSIDGTLADDSDDAVPTEKAVKLYVDTAISGISSDKINEGDSLVEVVDAGTGYIKFQLDNVEQMRMIDGKLYPITDDDISFGDATHRIKEMHLMPSSLYLGSTHITENSYNRNELNTMLAFFKIAINGSLSQFGMVDGITDEFEDETGVDTGSSTNESYDSGNDLYSPSSVSGLELDYMEYASDGAAQAAYVSSSLPLYISNGSLDDEDCSNISDWSDEDTGTGESSQVTFDSQETFKLDSGTAGANNAGRIKDVGVMPSTFVVTIKLYHSALGATTNDAFCLYVNSTGLRLAAYFGTDGLYISDGAGYQEVGTDLVKTGVWQTWTFDVDNTTPATATCDVYLDGVLKVSDVDCSTTGGFNDGEVYLLQKGTDTANRITYVDYVKVGNGFSPINLQSYSEDTIKNQGSYSLKAIAAITDSLNDTLTQSGLSIDLTDIDELKFDAYASRTGTNLQMQIKGITDANVKLLLHLNGSDEATVTTDESASNHSITFNNSAQLDTGDKKFGTGSVLFAETGAYVTMDNHADFDFGSGDFTIDFWVKRNSDIVMQRIGGQLTAGGSEENTFRFNVTTNIIRWQFKTDGGIRQLETVGTVTADSNWHHIALIRDGNTLKVGIDGTIDATTVDITGETQVTPTSKFSIGRAGDYALHYFDGLIDDFRISDTARWTTNFAVPTSEHTSDGNTKLLLHFNGNLTDSSSSAHVLTPNGGATLDGSVFGTAALNFFFIPTPFTHLKCNDDAANTTVTDDGTGANNGTSSTNTSNLSVAGKVNDAFEFTSSSSETINIDNLLTDIASDTIGTFTLWIKPDSITGTAEGNFIAFGETVDETWLHIWHYEDMLRFKVYTDDPHSGAQYDIASVLTGGWQHVAVVQDGVALKIYLDGVDVTPTPALSGTGTTAFWFANVPLLDNGRIGCMNNTNLGNVKLYDGLLDDIRYYQGVALNQAQVQAIYNSDSGTEDGAIGSYLSIPDSSDWDIVGSNSDNWTIDLWVKHISTTSYQQYLVQFQGASPWYEWQLYHLQGSGLSFRVWDNNAVVIQTPYGGEITDSDWHHIALIKVADEYAVYKDGVQISYIQDSSTATFSGSLRIGTIAGGTGSQGYYFDGSMDEIRITQDNAFSASPNVGLSDTITVPTSEHTDPITVSTKDIVISSADTWEEVTWDISGIANADKENIGFISIEVTNADAENTFYIDNFRVEGSNNNMTLFSNANVAEIEADSARIVIFEEDVDSVTLNTDLKAYVSRDGGSTWAEVTLADEGDYETDKRILTGIVDLTQSGMGSGTSMKYKIETLNTKDLKLHGVGLLWD